MKSPYQKLLEIAPEIQYWGFTNKDQHLKFESCVGFMPLSIEKVYLQCPAPSGETDTTVFSIGIMHHFTQNGDLMRDPDMTFAVYPGQEKIIPLEYEQSGVLYQRVYDDDMNVNLKLKRELTKFMGEWFTNILNQGYELKYRMCTDCGGEGEKREYCTSCKGEGKHRCNECDGRGAIEQSCRKCSGVGAVCTECNIPSNSECERDHPHYCHSCDECPGNGEAYYGHTECNGTGELNCCSCDGRGVHSTPCTTCNATGNSLICRTCDSSQQIDTLCKSCNGVGCEFCKYRGTEYKKCPDCVVAN